MQHEVKKARGACQLIACLPLLVPLALTAFAGQVDGGEAVLTGKVETLPARVSDAPDFRYTPSPSDWREVSIYQIITDRFFDGDPSNNTANADAIYNPFSMDALHGGDFAGIEAKLDYVKALGFRAIWISPVFLNLHGAYHGYHITDFNRIDPHWGTLADLRSMIDAAHTRGIYVIIDVVFNHMARLITSDDAGYPRFADKPYTLRWEDPNVTFAPPFNRLDYFHAFGSIENWEDDRQNVYGNLQGLADLKTEDDDVRRELTKCHIALIAATDCDGFRVDTAHHVQLDFWKKVIPEIRSGAAALGKTNFILFAEALRGKDEDVSMLTREGEYPSALYYPYYFTLIEIWGKRRETRLISERWNNLPLYGSNAMDQLVAFADNHDRARLLNDTYLNGDHRRLKAVLAMLYATPAIPCVYYGTEAGFSGSKGHRAREPMFDHTHPDLPDRFVLEGELPEWIRRLNAARDTYPALVRGSTKIVEDSDAAGLFVFDRSIGEQSVRVVANNSTKPITYTIPGDWIDIMTGAAYTGVAEPDTTLPLVPAIDYRPLPDASPYGGSFNEPAIKSNYPFISFKADGGLDASASIIASNETSALYAGWNPGTRMLYVASTPSPANRDRFILIALTNGSARVKAPWEKNGQSPRYDIVVSDEGDSDYTSVRGTRDVSWSYGSKTGVFEAAVRIESRPESPVERIYLRTELYETHDRGDPDCTGFLPACDSTDTYFEVRLDPLRRDPAGDR